jgi:hypothetical protein
VTKRRLVLALALARGGPLIVVAVALVTLAIVMALLVLAAAQLPSRLAATFVASLTAFFLLPFGILVVQILRALRAPSLANRAVLLERTRAPHLFERVAACAAQLRLREPRSLWISSGFEVTAVASAGRYDLVIGLPLLDLVDENELDALVAMELALSFAGDPLLARAYRAGRRLADLAAGITTRSGLARSIALIVAYWCSSLLDLRAIAKERNQFAQREAGRLATGASVAEARLRVSIYSLHANEAFWPDIVTRHAKNPEPPDAISQLRAFCRSPVAPENRVRLFNLAKAELDMGEATIPPADRTASLPASDTLIPEIAAALTEAFDKSWRASVADSWTQLHHEAAASLNDLERLEALHERDGLASSEAWQRLELIEIHRGEEVALPLFLDWVATHPKDGRAALFAGRALLKIGSPEGTALLKRAIDLDERYAIQACGLLAQDLVAQGRPDEATPYLEQRDKTLAEQQAALVERVRQRPMTVSPHGLGESELRALTEHIARFPMVSAVTIARRDVSLLPTFPCVVLGVHFSRTWRWWNGEKVRSILSALCEAPLEAQVIAFNLDSFRPPKELQRPPAVEIYRAPTVSRRVRVARWGRRAQRALVAIGVGIVVLIVVLHRDCFPDCFADTSALLIFGPIVVAVNALLLSGDPESTGQRAAAFVASAFFAGMLFFGGAFVLLFPVAIVALLRTPTTKRALTWVAGMGPLAFAIGWFVTTV